MDLEAKKPKILVEKIEILDESTGQIILKEQARLVYTSMKNDSGTDNEQRDSIIIEDFEDSTGLNLGSKPSSLDSEIDYTGNTTIQLYDDSNNNNLDSLDNKNKTSTDNLASGQRIIIIEAGPQTDSFGSLNTSNLAKKNLLNSGLSAHIVQNYSILAQEITAPLESPKSSLLSTDLFTSSSSLNIPTSSVKQWTATTTTTSRKNDLNKQKISSNSDNSRSPTSSTQNSTPTFRAQKDMATCQFCGRAMLKKNIPTHIRRAHTPKEELVCLNEEQNIFTFQHLKPGQRRKRSARAYDYSLMTATVSIDEDPCDGIENKFITEGEEILSTDLLQLADRIKYGISQIPISTLTKLIDILAKIEYTTQDEISANAKSIRNMICFYLTSGEEFKYKVKQVGDDINEKKKQVNNLRADLKEIMARKAQLERRIQPLICELQKLEDQHGNLIESILKGSDDMHFEIITNDTNESV